jgi:hypothetical protein
MARPDLGPLPFFEEPSTGAMAFLPMDDCSSASRGCPALGVYGARATTQGCVRPAPRLAAPSHEVAAAFFGPGSHGPAVWATRPDLD